MLGRVCQKLSVSLLATFEPHPPKSRLVSCAGQTLLLTEKRLQHYRALLTQSHLQNVLIDTSCSLTCLDVLCPSSAMRSVVSACFITLALVAGAAVLRLQASNSSLMIVRPRSALSGRPYQETLSAPAVAAPVSIDSGLQDLIKRLPKAELHIHIEGTLEASMMMRLAERNNISLPYANLAEAEAARCAACTGQLHIHVWYGNSRAPPAR